MKPERHGFWDGGHRHGTCFKHPDLEHVKHSGPRAPIERGSEQPPVRFAIACGIRHEHVLLGDQMVRIGVARRQSGFDVQPGDGIEAAVDGAAILRRGVGRQHGHPFMPIRAPARVDDRKLGRKPGRTERLQLRPAALRVDAVENVAARGFGRIRILAPHDVPKPPVQHVRSVRPRSVEPDDARIVLPRVAEMERPLRGKLQPEMGVQIMLVQHEHPRRPIRMPGVAVQKAGLSACFAAEVERRKQQDDVPPGDDEVVRHRHRRDWQRGRPLQRSARIKMPEHHDAGMAGIPEIPKGSVGVESRMGRERRRARMLAEGLNALRFQRNRIQPPRGARLPKGPELVAARQDADVRGIDVVRPCDGTRSGRNRSESRIERSAFRALLVVFERPHHAGAVLDLSVRDPPRLHQAVAVKPVPVTVAAHLVPRRAVPVERAEKALRNAALQPGRSWRHDFAVEALVAEQPRALR